MYFQSLQNKNQVLLNEKRQLLIKNREEFTKLEQDKVIASFNFELFGVHGYVLFDTRNNVTGIILKDQLPRLLDVKVKVGVDCMVTQI